MITLSERVNLRMQKLGLRQVDVAKLSKVAPSSVAQWRNGHTKELSGTTLLAAACALQCSPRWLATGLGLAEEEASTGAAHVVQDTSATYEVKDHLITTAIEILENLGKSDRADAVAMLKGFAAACQRESAHGKGASVSPQKRLKSSS